MGVLRVLYIYRAWQSVCERVSFDVLFLWQGQGFVDGERFFQRFISRILHTNVEINKKEKKILPFDNVKIEILKQFDEKNPQK